MANLCRKETVGFCKTYLVYVNASTVTPPNTKTEAEYRIKCRDSFWGKKNPRRAWT